MDPIDREAPEPRTASDDVVGRIRRGLRRLPPALGAVARAARRRPMRAAATIAATLLVAATAGSMIWVEPSLNCARPGACPAVEDLRTGSVFGEAIHIHDRHGRAMATVGGEKRLQLPYDSIPARVREAWIAVEDRRFREHGGVDALAIVRAALANLSEGGVAEGASTIPMQLARTIWAGPLEGADRWHRKVFEVRAARELVDRLGRDRVLELYLNGIYLGEGIYGVGAAARHYFGVRPGQLDAAQLATLVAMTKTPERYNPRRHPEKARVRRNLVLGILELEGIVESEEAEAARSGPVETVAAPPVSYQRSYVTAAVRRELRRVAPDLVGRAGLRVFTAIDPKIQAAGEEALTHQIETIESGEHGALQGGDQPLQGGALALDTRTGEILAVVGGRSFEVSELNRAIQSRRQVGSLAKPLVLAAAYRAGVSTARPISTAPIEIQTDQGPWRPRDHVDQARMLPREVLVRSSNRAAVRLGHEAGLGPFMEQVRTMGVETPVAPYPSSFLGAFEATLAEMTAAFAVFENAGYRVEPHLIRRIEDDAGRILWERRRPAVPTRVLDATTAYLVLDAMRGVVDEGTGWRVRQEFRGLAAGKTGTTNDSRDAWFIGLRPGLAAGVWIGYDRPAPITPGGDGGRLAAPAWGRWMAAVEPPEPAAPDWQPPRGLSRARYHAATRSIVPRGCPAPDRDLREVLVRETELWGLEICPRTDLRLSPRLGDDGPAHRAIRMPRVTVSGRGSGG